jgi:hypothetical protein
MSGAVATTAGSVDASKDLSDGEDEEGGKELIAVEAMSPSSVTEEVTGAAASKMADGGSETTGTVAAPEKMPDWVLAHLNTEQEEESGVVAAAGTKASRMVATAATAIGSGAVAAVATRLGPGTGPEMVAAAAAEKEAEAKPSGSVDAAKNTTPMAASKSKPEDGDSSPFAVIDVAAFDRNNRVVVMHHPPVTELPDRNGLMEHLQRQESDHHIAAVCSANIEHALPMILGDGSRRWRLA